MARCPACKRRFRTLEDEEGMHDCPYCGYFPEPRLALAEEEPEEVEAELLDWSNWERLAEAVDSGEFGPETEVDL